mgnify:CR=1 FL=1
MDWAFSVNVLGFFEKRPLQSRPYETPNFTFSRALGPGSKFKVFLGGGGFASRRFAPHPPKKLKISPRPKFRQRILKEYWENWKNFEKILPEKLRCLIVRFQFEWMNVSKSVVNSRTKFSQMAAHVLKINILVFSVILSNFSIKFLKRFRYRGEKVAPKRSKNWEFLQT